MRTRHIVFLTGTRADFGKLLPLMNAVNAAEGYRCSIFVTGMHTLQRYGYTADEARKAGLTNIHVFINQFLNEPMDLVLANTIQGLARYIQETKPDMLLVHGDRVEALAGAIVGVMRNFLVGHVEGGEVSGTVDELVRHSISKLAQVHFVSNQQAARRLIQMGEDEKTIFIIGSPEIDVMTSTDLPQIGEAKSHYEIPFDRYAIATFHSVTTEIDHLAKYARNFVDALIASGHNYVVIYPNNDEGSGIIFDEYRRLEGLPRFRLIPSVRFTMFLTLMKHCDFMIGNSSSGVREAPFYGVPTVNVGSRQHNRFTCASIIDTSNDSQDILLGIAQALSLKDLPCISNFGDGNSAKRFMDALNCGDVWDISQQKHFRDL